MYKLQVIDDLGYDDLALTGGGSQIVTPTMQRLANDGIIMSNYCPCSYPVIARAASARAEPEPRVAPSAL